MSTRPASVLGGLIAENETALLSDWMSEQERASTRRSSLISDVELEAESKEFLQLLRETLEATDDRDLFAPEWSKIQAHLSRLSRSRAEAGFSPSETATFVFSFKQPLFSLLRDQLSDDTDMLTAAIWEATAVLDGLGLITTEEYRRGREAVIERQQRELMELSTPVVKLWDGVLAVPLIGTLDSERTQVVMETLLQRIVETELDDRDHRHHRRADGRHAGRATSPEDGRGRPADGRGLHHQRHPAADRPDDRPPRRRSGGGDARRRPSRTRSSSRSKRPGLSITRVAGSADDQPMERIPILKMGRFSS